ncbi:MAG: hypothetical protein GC131_00550 [Alphaproteobacteria bacterium]|nr:hypothetical protein [Alphaproteobacteria bacterium]
MEKAGLWLSMLAAVAMALFILPGVVAMNQGRMLRNIAIWLAVFALLGWIYKAFGPFDTAAESRHGAISPPAQESEGDDRAGRNIEDALEQELRYNNDDSFSPPQE